MSDPGKRRRFQTRTVHPHRPAPPEQSSSSVPIFQSSTFRFETNEEFARAIRFDGSGLRVLARVREPHRRRVPVRDGRSRGRGVRDRIRLRHGGDLVAPPDRRERGLADRGGHGALRRHGVDAAARPSSLRRSRRRSWTPRTSTRSRDALPGADLFYCETIVNPDDHGPGSGGARRAVPGGRGPVRRRQHVRVALPLQLRSAWVSTWCCTPRRSTSAGTRTSSAGSRARTRTSSGGCATRVIDLGGSMQPLEAWLCLRGLSTLGLRMEHHCASAGTAAPKPSTRIPSVERVHYPGLVVASAARARRAPAARVRGHARLRGGGRSGGRQPGRGGAGARLDRREPGERDDPGRAPRFHHPPAGRSRRAAGGGIGDGLLRVAVGLEDPDDLIEDFTRALEKA